MSFFYAKRLATYLICSWHKKGHGIHSPFVYKLVTEVFSRPVQPSVVNSIKTYKKQLAANNSPVNNLNIGAATTSFRSRGTIKDVFRSSSIPDKYGVLLWRLCDFIRPENILELGTCLGVSTAWIAISSKNNDHCPRIVTIEGNQQLSAVAENLFAGQQMQGCTFLKGDFSVMLPEALRMLGEVDFAFIDGNHREEPTLEYFNLLLPHINRHSILVFDDIHWSVGMERAWNRIKAHPEAIITVDICRMGIVFFDRDANKQDFVVRY